MPKPNTIPMKSGNAKTTKSTTKQTTRPVVTSSSTIKKTETLFNEQKIRPEPLTIKPVQETPPNQEKGREKKQLKWLGPMSYGKIMAIGMAFFGLIYGLIIAMLVSWQEFMAGMMTSGSQSEFALYQNLGWWLVLILPVAYALLGFLSGVIGAAIYNLVAKWIGGIEVELE